VFEVGNLREAITNFNVNTTRGTRRVAATGVLGRSAVEGTCHERLQTFSRRPVMSISVRQTASAPYEGKVSSEWTDNAKSKAHSGEKPNRNALNPETLLRASRIGARITQIATISSSQLISNHSTPTSPSPPSLYGPLSQFEPCRLHKRKPTPPGLHISMHTAPTQMRLAKDVSLSL